MNSSKGRMCMWVSNVCLCALLGTFILKVPNSCGVLNCPPCTQAKMRAHKHTQHSGDILPVFVWLLRKHMRRFSTSAYETNGSEMLHVESQFLSNSHPACLWTLWVHEWRPKRFSSETFCVRENVRASRSFCFHCCGSVLSQYGVKNRLWKKCSALLRSAIMDRNLETVKMVWKWLCEVERRIKKQQRQECGFFPSSNSTFMWIHVQST